MFRLEWCTTVTRPLSHFCCSCCPSVNLAINASKFVESGFIRLRAEVKEDNVIIYCEDSGLGVPESKRQGLFDSFQNSLDPLSEGTGIGLSICFNLCQLLGAKIWLDHSYHSGIRDRPGSRFVVELQKPSLNLDSAIGDVLKTPTDSKRAAEMLLDESTHSTDLESNANEPVKITHMMKSKLSEGSCLPENINVL